MLVSGAKDPLAEALDALPAGRAAPPRRRPARGAVHRLPLGRRARRPSPTRSPARPPIPHGRAVVVVALRADFYGRFAAYPGLAELLGANHVLVGPMQASELRRAVELPAGRVGLRVEPELSDALVDDVEGEPGALPLLSTALLELWQKRQDNTLTLAAYRESGGVHGAVARLAEGTYARIPDERKPLVRAIMLRLVGEGEGDAPVRRRAPLAELDLERNEDVADVLATLADSRLVTRRRGLRRGRPRGAAARMAAPARVDRGGRRRTPASPSHHPGGDRVGRGRARSGRALPRRPPRRRARLDRRSRARRSTSSSGSSSTESREASERETKRARRTNRRLRALLAGVAVLLVAAVARRDLRRRPARRGARRRDGPARPAPRRAGARRGGPRPLAPARPPGGRDRRLAADPRLPARRPPALAAVVRILHGQSDAGSVCAVSPSAPTGRRSRSSRRRRAPLLRRPDVRAARRAAAGRARRALAYSPDGETLAFGGSSSRRRRVPSPASTRARGSELAQVRLGRARPTRLAFTTDGSQLVVVESVQEGDELDHDPRRNHAASRSAPGSSRRASPAAGSRSCGRIPASR